MGILEGKVVVVTGAGRGIGRAHALKCAREGARVVVNDMGVSPSGVGFDPSVAEAVAAEIKKAGGKAIADAHDVGKRDQVEALFRSAVDRLGQVDLLVTNAGIVRESPIAGIADEDWDAQLRTMLGGTYLCTQAFVRHLERRKAPGRIVMVASQLGLQGAANVAAYCAAKGAICGFGLSAAQELAPLGITVNILSPMAYTRLTADLPLMDFPDAEQILSPDFCADVSAFLLSDEASEVSGKIVHVQGTQVSVFRIGAPDGVGPRDGERWTAPELTRRWSEIVR
jgi:NAD(P)-dependent dehydrogenase (short-subunit alcohol dehydrogenase family)